MINFLLNPSLIAWVPVIFFFIGPWAQIIRNYKAKDTGGLSHRSVFLVASGLSCIVLYNFFMWLPLAYRVMHPLILSTWLVLAWQEYIYRANKQLRRRMRIAYGALAVAMPTIFMWGQTDPLRFGMIMGWSAALLLATFQIPQVLKNSQNKSVKGLSYLYLSILSLGSFVEMCIAFWLMLPLQSVLNGVRGVSFYIIFVYQYLRYRPRRGKTSTES